MTEEQPEEHDAEEEPEAGITGNVIFRFIGGLFSKIGGIQRKFA